MVTASAAYRDSGRLGKVDFRDRLSDLAWESHFGSIVRSSNLLKSIPRLKVVVARPLPEAGGEVLESLFIGLGAGFTLRYDFVSVKPDRIAHC